MPTKIIAGRNAVAKNSDQLVLGRKAFIVTGRHSGYASGALQDVCDIFLEKGIDFVIYDKIENNPSIENVYEAGKEAVMCDADFVVGIGGGSPLDASKAIAVYAANPIAPMDIYKGDFKKKPLPIAAIPTTAGTGSEVTPYAILTLHQAGTKRSFTCEDCFPKVAFLDGKYTQKLPLQTTRNTAVDAMCHCIEGYLTNKSSEASDYIALEGLSIIGKNIDALIDGNFSFDVCQDMLWVSCLGGITISQTSTTIVHSMGYQLTYCRDIPHGMANGLLLGSFLEWCYDTAQNRIDTVLDSLGIKDIEELKSIMKKLLPCDEKFSMQEIERWVDVSITAKNINTPPKPVDRGVELSIYSKSLL